MRVSGEIHHAAVEHGARVSEVSARVGGVRRSALALGLFVGCARPAAPADDAALPAPVAVADAVTDQGAEVHDVAPDGVDPCPGGHDALAWSASAIVADRTPLEAKVVSDTLTRARVEIDFALPAARTAALDLGRRAGNTQGDARRENPSGPRRTARRCSCPRSRSVRGNTGSSST